jgi:hypothetical protein
LDWGKSGIAALFFMVKVRLGGLSLGYGILGVVMRAYSFGNGGELCVHSLDRFTSLLNRFKIFLIKATFTVASSPIALAHTNLKKE